MTSTYSQRQAVIEQISALLKNSYGRIAQANASLAQAQSDLTNIPASLQSVLSDISGDAASGTIAFQVQADQATNLLNEVSALLQTATATASAASSVVATPIPSNKIGA